MEFSVGRKLFYQELQQPDEQINLERAALYIALEEYPTLDIEAYLNALDVMAAEVQERLSQEVYPLRIVQTINQYLYQDLGFVGNTGEYYDPRNSFLNDVIDRRTGIPITLSLVYLGIAARVNFPMIGIGMPGHFLIRPTVGDMEVFIDAFNQGEVLFPEDCRDRMAQLFQQPITLRPEFLEPISARQFLARMLTNLKMIYLDQRNLPKALAASERIILLFPNISTERRDRGVLYYRLHRLIEARQDFEDYLALVPNAKDASAIRQLLDDLEYSDG
jgi:regulator of sirC expression with transglutaminase-like and TPR domain